MTTLNRQFVFQCTTYICLVCMNFSSSKCLFCDLVMGKVWYNCSYKLVVYIFCVRFLQRIYIFFLSFFYRAYSLSWEHYVAACVLSSFASSKCSSAFERSFDTSSCVRLCVWSVCYLSPYIIVDRTLLSEQGELCICTRLYFHLTQALSFSYDGSWQRAMYLCIALKSNMDMYLHVYVYVRLRGCVCLSMSVYTHLFL